MRIAATEIGETLTEQDLYESLLPLDNARILELGCGAGAHTRNIAARGLGRAVVAYEVDDIQHKKNLVAEHSQNIEFKYGGAEEIAEADESVDVVMMFKSLHHVPIGNMAVALQEIHRVLKPNGLAYISEPVFDGPFNEVLRLFHDEQHVRECAFEALKNAVDSDLFELEKQVFFSSPVHFDNFEELDESIIQATHTQHSLDAETYEQVRAAFQQHVTADGADFLAPMRVDLLRKR
ncbi:MAG: class I SAM-dependent methyltransferase [Gammaproteobacteria bacterium]